jgi:hypothetical protein
MLNECSSKPHTSFQRTESSVTRAPIHSSPSSRRKTAAMGKPDDLPPMTYRFLGRSGLQVSSISLGGWLTYGGHVEKGELAPSLSR